MAEHAHRCGHGCPFFDGDPPLYLRVRPEMGICRADRPRARYARIDQNEVLPAWPWVDGSLDFCGEHPAVAALAHTLKKEALA